MTDGPDAPDAQIQQAYALLKAGHKLKAYAMLEPLVKERPDSPEGWWLLANAAPSDELVVDACQHVLALKPNYGPALQLFTREQLKRANALLESKCRPEARAMIQSVLDIQPENVDCWWLMANAAPSQVDSVMALQKLLAIEPDHALGRQMLATVQQQSVATLTRKYKNYDKTSKKRKTPWWLLFATLGIICLILGGGYVSINLTGNTLGLPIAEIFNAKTNMGTLGEKALQGTGTLVVGSKHDYTFYGRANTEVLLLITFPTIKGNARKAIKILGPTGKAIDVGPGDGIINGAQLDFLLPASGTYTLRLTGTAGIAQGPYQFYLGASYDLGNLSNFSDYSDFANSLTAPK